MSLDALSQFHTVESVAPVFTLTIYDDDDVLVSDDDGGIFCCDECYR